MQQHVLVTGGAGYIGGHVCKALHQAGFIPVTYDNLSQGKRSAVKWGPLVQKDLHDKEALIDAMRVYKPVAVIHLASLIDARESQKEPAKYYHNNVTATLVLLEAMRHSHVFYFVFSSSAAVYGTPRYVPIDEQHEKNPQNTYGKTKWMVEEILQDYYRAYGLSSLSLRYFNAAGADPDGQLGETHDPETHLIPLTIQTALGIRPSLSVYGTDFPTKDGTAIRDYIHVSDLADAHVRALKYLFEKKECLALNLGTGNGYSVREIITEIEKITKKPLPHELSPRNPADPSVLIADAKAATHLLAWRPRFSDLPTLLSTALSWHKTQ